MECDFFKLTQDEDLIKYENWFAENVKTFAKRPSYGFFCSFWDKFWGPKVDNWFLMRAFGKEKVYQKSIQIMKDINPDIVFSTHWATHYYAVKSGISALTFLYCPDAELCEAFSYPSDCTIISTNMGYDKGLKNVRGEFTEDNLVLSSQIIRDELFDMSFDKNVYREELGLPMNNFTMLFMEGGYGHGKTEKICQELLNTDKNVTIIVACGTNEEMYKRLSSIKTKENITLVPLQMTNKVLHYLAASDLFLGKGCNTFAEATFLGVPSIVITVSNQIERNIGKFYSEEVKCAIVCKKVKKIVKQINQFLDKPSLLEVYRSNAIKDHNRYGVRKVVKLVYDKIKDWESKNNIN